MKKLEDILIGPGTSIIEAIEIINRGALQITLVVDSNKKLLGTVTDGDIRRGILKGISFSSTVKEVMNSNPIIANLDDDRMKILSRLRKNSLRQIPILDRNGVVINIEYIDNLIEQQNKDNFVILMAGGLGSRLSPLTDTIPKPLLKVGNKPILETIIENFAEQGFGNFYLSVNYKAEIIEKHFGDGKNWGVNIDYLYEDKKLGTAGALSLIKEKPNKPIIVMNGDILTKINFNQLLDFHNSTMSKATMCVREYNHQIPYGVVNINKHKLLTIEEKPISTYFVNAGIYVLDPDVIDFIPNDKFYNMPDLFEKLINLGYETSAFPIREYWLDIGQYDDFKKANGEYFEVFK